MKIYAHTSVYPSPPIKSKNFGGITVGQFPVVSGKDNGSASGIDVFKNIDNLRSDVGIKIPGRLISQE